tara:strand:+ start:1395 stop:1625 length:231 start_codon:yes stop_codon:yes gene_type:complete
VDSFHEGEQMLYIMPEDLGDNGCINCNNCVAECPVEAIFDEADVPEDQLPFIELNREMAPKCPVITERKEPLCGGD